MNKRIRTYDPVRVPTRDATTTYVKPIGKFAPATIGADIERLIGRVVVAHDVRKDRTAVSEIDLRGRLALAWDTAARALDSLEDVVREAEEIDRKAAAPGTSGAKKTTDGNATSMTNIVGEMNRANSEFWNR